jgi:hypothetical protein
MRQHKILGLAASITVLLTAVITDGASAQRGRQNGPRTLLSEPCDPCGSDGATGTELLFRSTPKTSPRQRIEPQHAPVHQTPTLNRSMSGTPAMRSTSGMRGKR